MLVYQSKQTGFTLIELMIAVLIFAIAASIAVPSYRQIVIDSRVRTEAESILNGIQKARAEAVSRNTNVTFTLGAGTSWTVNVVNPASTIESRSSSEGSTNVTPTNTPNTSTTVTFTNLGGVATANAAAPTVPLTQVELNATNASRKLRVVINAGGNARMCDPNWSLASDPRGC
jgi:type IV fimbrial biogenesis protein FimT